MHISSFARSPLLLALGLLLARPALAQDEAVPDEAIEKAKAAAAVTERVDGWKLSATVGATMSFLNSNKVVGQVDGTTLTIGGLARLNADLTWGDHEWLNSAAFDLLQTKTPSLEPFVKAADLLDVRSLYLYHLPWVSWVGPYARLRAFTPVLPGEGIAATDTTVRRLSADGSARTQGVPAQTAFPLTSWFEPLTITESIGAFAEPVKTDAFNLNLRAGAGAQHMIARDGFTIADDAATPELEVSQLQTIHSAGAEAALDLKGVLIKDRLSWGAGAAVYYPLVTSITPPVSGVELTHVDLGGNISVKLAEGLSADYVLRVTRQPFILNDWQVLNSLLLSLSFSLL